MKDRMLMGGTLVIALVDKTRLAGHAAQASALPTVKFGLHSAPGYTGGIHLDCEFCLSYSGSLLLCGLALTCASMHSLYLLWW